MTKKSQKQFVLFLLILNLSFVKVIAEAQSQIPLQDTILAYDYLHRAENLMDSSKYEKALPLAQQAEDILLHYFTEDDIRMSDTYCIAGLCWLKFNLTQSEQYLQKIIRIKQPATGIHKAHQLYLQASVLLYQGAIDEGIQIYKEALAIYDQAPGKIHPNAVRICNNLGVLLMNKGNYQEALNYYNLGFQKGHEIYDQLHPIMGHLHNNRGLVYSYMGSYNAAPSDYAQAVKIRASNADLDTPQLVVNSEYAASLINSSLLYNSMGDYDRASELLNLALDISIKIGNPYYISFIYTNMGITYTGLQLHEKAREYYKKTLELEETLYEADNFQLASTNYNIAVSYKDEGLFSEALPYYSKALMIAKPDNPNLSSYHNGVGTAYLGINNFQEAKSHFKSALNISKNKFGDFHPTVANAYFSMAKLSLKENLLDEALQWNKLAEQSNNHTFKSSPDEIEISLDNCYILLQKIQILYKQALINSSREKLEEVLETCNNAISIYNKLYETYGGTTSKAQLINFNHSIFETSIAARLALSDITNLDSYKHEAFTFAERSKAFLLYEALREAEALQIADIPDSLLRREYDLEVEIAYYDKKRQELLESGLTETDTAVLALVPKRSELKEAYASLKQNFELHYPKYFQAKYDLESITVREVQQEILRPGQSLLEYVVGDSSIFAFLVQKDHLEVRELSKDSLELLVKQLTREGIYGLQTRQVDQTTAILNYTHAAARLYEKLLKPFDGKLTEQLIIIPDGILGYVPFEALLTEMPSNSNLGSFSQYSYLLFKHRISYSYSATLLQQMQLETHQTKTSGELLAMAPFYFEDVAQLHSRPDSLEMRLGINRGTSLNALKGSGLEVAGITDIWNGKPYYGKDASLQVFGQLAEQYRILHLSTHGKADDRVGDYAYLAFSAPDTAGVFDKLYARDIYTFSLNADMVVLSACETGIGQLQRGEGIVSLARAFAYAGAKSMVTTLWNVNDSKTSELMVEFYALLNNGMEKDLALQTAKINYLKRQEGRGHTSADPLYWAGPIIIGDTARLR